MMDFDVLHVGDYELSIDDDVVEAVRTSDDMMCVEKPIPEFTVYPGTEYDALRGIACCLDVLQEMHVSPSDISPLLGSPEFHKYMWSVCYSTLFTEKALKSIQVTPLSLQSWLPEYLRYIETAEPYKSRERVLSIINGSHNYMGALYKYEHSYLDGILSITKRGAQYISLLADCVVTLPFTSGTSLKGVCGNDLRRNIDMYHTILSTFAQHRSAGIPKSYCLDCGHIKDGTWYSSLYETTGNTVDLAGCVLSAIAYNNMQEIVNAVSQVKVFEDIRDFISNYSAHLRFANVSLAVEKGIADSKLTDAEKSELIGDLSKLNAKCVHLNWDQMTTSRISAVKPTEESVRHWRELNKDVKSDSPILLTGYPMEWMGDVHE